MKQPRNMPDKGSQRAVILQALIDARGEKVGLNHLMRVAACGCVHSQVAAMRKIYGAEISNETKGNKSAKRKDSSYWLENWKDFTDE